MARDLSKERYGSVWDNKIQPHTLAMTLGLCILCFCKAKRVHHAYYVNFFGERVKDREIPGWGVFPLCITCHGWVHRFVRWVQYKAPKEHLSRNKRTFVWYLRVRFALAYVVVRCFWLGYYFLMCLGVLGLLSAFVVLLARSRQQPQAPVPLNDLSGFSREILPRRRFP